MRGVTTIRSTSKTAHLDTRWLVDRFILEVQSTTVKMWPDLRITMGVWSVLTPPQQEEVRTKAKELKVKLEIVP